MAGGMGGGSPLGSASHAGSLTGSTTGERRGMRERGGLYDPPRIAGVYLDASPRISRDLHPLLTLSTHPADCRGRYFESPPARRALEHEGVSAAVDWHLVLISIELILISTNLVLIWMISVWLCSLMSAPPPPEPGGVVEPLEPGGLLAHCGPACGWRRAERRTG